MTAPEVAAWERFYSGLLGARRSAADSSTGESPRHRMGRVKVLIDAEYARALDLERLAREAHVSRFHFARTFRETFGEPPHRYLQRRRVEAARWLLETTDLSITDICLEVGFTSLGSFSRLFTERVGVAPSHYRRRSYHLGMQFGAGQASAIQRPIPCCFLSVYSGLRLPKSS